MENNINYFFPTVVYQHDILRILRIFPISPGCSQPQYSVFILILLQNVFCFTVVTGSGDKTARAYDAKSGATKRIFKGHASSINSVVVRIFLAFLQLRWVQRRGDGVCLCLVCVCLCVSCVCVCLVCVCVCVCVCVTPPWP